MSGKDAVAGDVSNAEDRPESGANPGGKADTSDSRTLYATTRRQLNTDVFEDVLAQVETEPAVPDDINQKTRRQTRLAPESHKTERLPRPLVVCGCGECPDRYDPLADPLDVDTHTFGDHLDRSGMAADECEDAQPISIDRAAEAYYRYQMAAYHREDWTSRLERVEDEYGRYMDAERRLLADMDSPSTALVSLRVSPLEGGECERSQTTHGITQGKSNTNRNTDTDTKPDRGTRATHSNTEGSEESQTTHEITRGKSQAQPQAQSPQRWVESVRLVERLKDSWERVRDRLGYHLDGFDWEYVYVLSTTDKAATPHLHVVIYVDDPDDELIVEHLRPAVESYIRNTTGAYPEDHRVSADESDAATVFHDPPRISYEPCQVRQIKREMGTDSFQANTQGLTYLLSQRPDWALRRILDGDSTPQEEQSALEGAAIAWSSSKKWIGSSTDFPTNSD